MNNKKMGFAFSKARLKWTIYFTISIVLLVMAISAIVYINSSRKAIDRFDRTLVILAEKIHFRLKEMPVMVRRKFLEELENSKVYTEFLLSGENIIQLLNTNWEVIFSTGTLVDEENDTLGFANIEGRSSDGEKSKTFRTITKPIKGPLGENLLYLRVGTDIDNLQEQLNFIFYTIIFFLFLSAIGGWFIGYFLSSNVLKPVKESYERLSQFSYDTSHELKTPVSVLRTTVDILKKKYPLTDEVKNKVEILDRNIKRIERLIKQLLKTIWIKKSNIEYDTETIKLKDFFEDLQYEFESYADIKNIKLEFKCNEEVILKASREILQTIMENLIENALKFTNKNGEVTFGAESDSGKVILFVQDNGRGIEESEQKKIFEKFYKNSKSRTVEGAGMGLAIVKELAEKINAKLCLKSSLDEGSRFEVHIKR